MKIVFDLDGVLRDLNGYLSNKFKCAYPDKWEYKYNGKSIYDCINKDIRILIKAHPTSYLKVVKQHFENPEIWTSQSKGWQEPTLEWIKIHVGSKSIVRFMNPKDKVKELNSLENVILIEDNPNLDNYDKIILIDRPYNKEVKNVLRVFGTKSFNNILETLKNS